MSAGFCCAARNYAYVCCRERGHDGAHADVRSGFTFAWLRCGESPPPFPNSPDGRPWGDHDDASGIVTGTHTQRGGLVMISAQEYHALCRAVTERDAYRARVAARSPAPEPTP